MTRKPTPTILDDVLSTHPATTVKLSIDQIKTDGGTQMRAGLHEATVLEYLEAMAPIGWSDFPPIIVYHDGSDYWLADGFHRIEAYRRAAAQLDQPADRIPADVRAGTRRDAILYAAGANAQHGLRRTNADKRRAVETLLRDEEWRQWSDREIGRRCDVSDVFVGKVRREMTANGLQSPAERTGADGRTINTANIGTTRTYASGLPVLDMPLKPGSPEAKALGREVKAATWGDKLPAKTSYPEPPKRSQIVGCVDTLAWEAVPSSEEKRLAHMEAPENFSIYYLAGVRSRTGFPVNQYSVKEALAVNIQRMRKDLAGAPEPETITDPVKEIVVDGDRPLPDWAADDDADDGLLTPEIMATLKPMPVVSVLTDKEQAMIKPLLVTERRARLAALETRFDQTLKALPEWSELTGRHTATGEAERGLRRLLELTRRELAILRGEPVEEWGEVPA